jgi:uncharacterized cupredoxin-like copper-binding protein
VSTQTTDGFQTVQDAAPPVDELGGPTLATVVEEVRAQSARARRTQQGFAFFAVLAFVIALVNLIVIAAKLNDTKTVTQVVTRSATAVTGAGAAAATGSTTAAGTTAAAALPHKVGVKLAEFSVSPTVTTAGSGKVTFNVQNAGKITHEFVVIRTNRKAADLLGKGGRADESGNIGETGDLQPGQAKALTLKLPPGHYALVCNLPGHYQAGQHVDFTVK